MEGKEGTRKKKKARSRRSRRLSASLFEHAVAEGRRQLAVVRRTSKVVLVQQRETTWPYHHGYLSFGGVPPPPPKPSPRHITARHTLVAGKEGDCCRCLGPPLAPLPQPRLFFLLATAGISLGQELACGAFKSGGCKRPDSGYTMHVNGGPLRGSVYHRVRPRVEEARLTEKSITIYEPVARASGRDWRSYVSVVALDDILVPRAVAQTINSGFGPVCFFFFVGSCCCLSHLSSRRSFFSCFSSCLLAIRFVPPPPRDKQSSLRD